jgi:nicotinate-nucleotide pyrophosphorylase (carboxylating)
MHPEIVQAVRRALAEDVGSGDITTELCVTAGRKAEGRFVARQQIIAAGLELLSVIYEQLGGVDELRLDASSDACIKEGQTLASVRGSARTLLTAERTALNFLQRLSGIATLSRQYVDAVAGTRCRILDTRKTTPGLRHLEKMATAAGGVTNHRMGLFDAVLIKNNHIVAAGGVRAALEKALGRRDVPVEIEVRTEVELEEALSAGATRLLLDNLTPEQAHAWVHRVDGRATTEISGRVTLDTVRAYAESGCDFISVGAITHSAPAVDINFRIRLLSDAA